MLGLLRRFRKNKKGLAAVEFALILPVMITLFFGVVEVSMLLSARAAVSNVASVTADLVAQKNAMTTGEMSNVFSAASTILYPYPDAAAQITVSSIVYDTASKSLTSGKVAWSCTKNGTAKSVGSTATLPDGVMTVDGSVIVSEIKYDYASPTTQIVAGTVPMTNTFYTKPRRVLGIPGPSPCP
jgi:Flp pilus assembly protein TadG